MLGQHSLFAAAAQQEEDSPATTTLGGNKKVEASSWVDLVVGLRDDGGDEDVGAAASSSSSSSSSVGVGTDGGAVASELLAADYGAVVETSFRRIKAVTMKVPASQVEQLQNDPRVAWIEGNRPNYPIQNVSPVINSNDVDQNGILLEETVAGEEEFDEAAEEGGGGERVPWGIPVIQADRTEVPLPDLSEECFKFCIVDTGMMVDHPDIPFEKGVNVMGKEFSIPVGQTWDRPVNYHGTHIAGTIIAQGNNGIGITGVIPNNQNICLLIARVFDDLMNTQADGYVVNAVEWCVDNGARVINMSLGGTAPTIAWLDTFYRDLYEKDGVLVFAASGNDGDDAYGYPASYNYTISVSSIDQNFTRPFFSTYNDKVDLTAPGTEVESTSPEWAAFDAEGTRYEIMAMEWTPLPNIPVEGEIAECGLGLELCTGVSGKICLIERGENTFGEKARNCEKAGGIGMIVYNNNDEEGLFFGTLESEGVASIPCVSVSREDGFAFMNTSRATISFQVPGYSMQDGTSMSTAYVSGVAAKIWAARPQCTNEQIKEALFATALDVGEPGKDDFFGHGVVQALDAYNYLLRQPEPCGQGTPNAPAPAPVPPVAAPVNLSCRQAGEMCAVPSQCCSGVCLGTCATKVELAPQQPPVSEPGLEPAPVAPPTDGASLPGSCQEAGETCTVPSDCCSGLCLILSSGSNQCGKRNLRAIARGGGIG
jgi:subtilisin family serine protease